MAPPTYADLGKSAKDLFNKGYNFGYFKIDHNSKAGANNEVEFKSAASHNIASGKLTGNLDVKYKIPSYGLTLTEKWNTDNTLGTVLEVNDQLAKGLKLTLDTTYAPHAGKRSGVVKAEWFNDCLKVNGDIALDVGPVVNVSAVAAHQGWLLGLQTGLDTSTNKLKGTNVAFGRSCCEYTTHIFMNDGNEFGASLFHRINKNVEVGAQLGWTVGDNAARFGLATKYSPTSDLTLRAKVDQASNVALASTHALNQQLKLTLSSQFSLSKIQDGGHKFGLGLEYEP